MILSSLSVKNSRRMSLRIFRNKSWSMRGLLVRFEEQAVQSVSTTLMYNNSLILEKPTTMKERKKQTSQSCISNLIQNYNVLRDCNYIISSLVLATSTLYSFGSENGTPSMNNCHCNWERLQSWQHWLEMNKIQAITHIYHPQDRCTVLWTLQIVMPLSSQCWYG